MKRVLSRREWIWSSSGGAAALVFDHTRAGAQVPDDVRLARETLDFIVRCGRADGGYAPSPDPAYAGESDTGFSDLAAVTYAAVLARTDGDWNIKEPDWDVHACFDAVFILRQLGGNEPKVKQAIARGADWSLNCRNRDGGFGHCPGRPSEMDAVYFQFGTLIQAGRVPGARRDLPDAQTLGWGHAMEPGKVYRNGPSRRG